jgi:apolipoprotein D and lipocalin family protein
MGKFLFLAVVIMAAQVSANELPEVKVVPHVDLSKYVGTWYEIARYPMYFQEGCLASSASYTLRADGTIQVINRCSDETDGHLRETKGKAWVVDSNTNAKLKVSFFWPFRGDYWIIDLGSHYEYAVVSNPNRKYLWILARKPELEQPVLDGIIARLEEQHFDIGRLVWRKDEKPTPGH